MINTVAKRFQLLSSAFPTLIFSFAFVSGLPALCQDTGASQPSTYELGNIGFIEQFKQRFLAEWLLQQSDGSFL